jgi:hypothetical protein
MWPALRMVLFRYLCASGNYVLAITSLADNHAFCLTGPQEDTVAHFKD